MEHDARRAERFQARARVADEALAEAHLPRALIHQDVVDRAVAIEEHVPVARLEPGVGVADDRMRGRLLRDHEDDVRVLPLCREETRVPLLDRLDEQEAARIERVVVANELRREARDLGEIRVRGGADGVGCGGRRGHEKHAENATKMRLARLSERRH